MNYQTHSLGFSSTQDFFKAVFGSPKKTNMKNLILLSIFITLGIVPFIENWIWSPFWSLMLFTAVFTLDFVAAIFVAMQKKDDLVVEGFKTHKGLRFILSLGAAWVILAFAFNLQKLNAEWGEDLLSSKVLNTFAIVMYLMWLLLNIASAVKHLSKLGLIPKPVAKFFIKYVDTHKNLIMKAQQEKQEPTEGVNNIDNQK
jgi:hypothetical protein